MRHRAGRSAARAAAVRAAASLTVAVALAAAPALGMFGTSAHVPGAGAVTPAEAIGLVPNPAPAYARVSIDSVTPDLIDATLDPATGTGTPTVTVTGTVRNVGDAPLRDLDLRLQRGPAATPETGTREPLTWDEPSFIVHGEFERVAAELAPGDELPFSLSLPLSPTPQSGDEPTLEVTEPGVYPLLVNVNGTPEGESPARLDEARTLLPVLEMPSGDVPALPSVAELDPGAEPDDPADPEDPADPDDPAEPAPEPAEPLPVTVVLPFASQASRLGHLIGADADPGVMLTDDTLLRELGPEGRLTGLLDAADTVFAGAGGGALRSATCLAVDPGLLYTVAQIESGAPVYISEDELGRTLARGDSGAREDRIPPAAEIDRSGASDFLQRLRGQAADMCVVPLPGEQADLDAVARIDSAELTGAALDETGRVARILETDTFDDILLPATGALGPGTAGVIQRRGSTAIVAANSVRTVEGLIPEPGLVDIVESPTSRALTYDIDLGSALAATGTRPENPLFSDPQSRYWLGADSPAARLQDARASLVAPLVSGAEPARSGVLAVPPAVWSVDRDSAGSLLGTVATQIDRGRFAPAPLEERLDAPPDHTDATLVSDPTGGADPGRVPEETTGAVASALDELSTLRALADRTDPRGAVADSFIDPLIGDGLRAVSATGRRAGGDGVTIGAETGVEADRRGSATAARLEKTASSGFDGIDLLPPGSVFTMASPNSPLMLVVLNRLPFPVRVGLDVTAPPGLHVEDLGLIQVPGDGSRTLQIPTEATGDAAGRRTVTFTLTGPDGAAISSPVPIAVQTGGYPLAVIFTGTVGLLALVLVGRRALRYRRGTPDPADEGHRP